jgi:cardiolipin synthase
VQVSFLEDWYWASRDVLELSWVPEMILDRDQRILVLPTGPADDQETCSLMFTHLINSARKKIWIVSPYFVPDESVLSALRLAALRGVDVRVMIPEKPDHRTVYLAGFACLKEIEGTGVRIYRYLEGFLHQKVFLVDDDLAGVGTANLDNRSLRLNFEITLAFADRNFAKEMETMLEEDFKRCREVEPGELQRKPYWFQVAVRVARLLSPIL